MHGSVSFAYSAVRHLWLQKLSQTAHVALAIGPVAPANCLPDDYVFQPDASFIIPNLGLNLYYAMLLCV